MAQGPDLPARFLAQLQALGLGDGPARVVVAVSGGCDSVTLLFLLRFFARHLPLELTVAHLDHAMRPDSCADARWVAGVCAAWEVPLVTERLEVAPGSEAAARAARYAFLRAVADRAGTRLVMTAHHADDQAETVLFRALRGTGLTGLGGMRPRTSTGVLRPLLPFWREEIERFARAHGVRWRTDPTNRSLDPARNRLRHELLPLAERHIAPAARRNLVSLAALARQAEAALAAETRRAARALVRREGEAYLLARGGLRDYDSAIGSRLLRHLLRRFGVVLDRTGTRTALQFITHAASGRELQLPSGVRIRVEFDVARIERAASPPADAPLEIGGAEEGRGEARIGGRAFGVSWRVGEVEGELDAEPRGWRVALPLEPLELPLQLRGWQPGDRLRTAGGSKPLKKLLLEHRVPKSLRSQLPVLVDAAGTVLWVAGVPRAPAFRVQAGQRTLFLTILHD